MPKIGTRGCPFFTVQHRQVCRSHGSALKTGQSFADSRDLLRKLGVVPPQHLTLMTDAGRDDLPCCV